MKRTIGTILKTEIKKVTIAVLLILVGMLVAFTIFSSTIAGRQMCALVDLVASKYTGPISRELALGDSETSQVHFVRFLNDLKNLGLSPELNLSRSTETAASTQAICQSSFLSSEISIPISFGGSRVASIYGSITGSHGLNWLLIAVAIVFIIAMGFWFLLKALTQKLEKTIVGPIRNISEGKVFNDDLAVASEVIEIRNNFEFLKERFLIEENEKHTLLKDKELSDFARQIAHDIKSPLSALSAIEAIDFNFIENKAMLFHATNRIRSIANLLVDRYHSKSSVVGSGSCLLLDVLEHVTIEKRVQFPNVDIIIEDSLQIAFLAVAIDEVELSRIISNILQNAVEAVESKVDATIRIKAIVGPNGAEIIISDNGVGIPEEILPKILNDGISFNKPNGQGIGISAAQRSLKAASGQLSISSELGNGTSVKIAIPIVSSLKWLCSEVRVHSGSRIVVIDDDPSILELWKGKLSGIESHFYTSVHELDTGQENSKNDIFLIDYDLGAGLASGLEFIKNSNFEKQSVLVTSQYDRKDIQNEAIKLGLKILPKNRISAISIKNFYEGNDWDLILIDDDDLVHDAWNFEAKRSKRKLKTFFDLEQFRWFTVNKTVPIFVDYQLESIDGVSVANELHVLGFENIYLATGQPIDSVTNLPVFVKSILGKEFPSHVL